MDALEFMEQARKDALVSGFLREVTTGLESPDTEVARRYVTLTGVDLLFAVGAYALFRWLKDLFDHRRGLQEIDLVQQQAQLITRLTQDDGLPLKEAQAVVDKLFKRVREGGLNDPALQAVLKLVKGPAGK